MAKKRKNPEFDTEKVDAFLNAFLKGEDTSSEAKKNPIAKSKRKNPLVEFDELEISNPLSNIGHDFEDEDSDDEEDFEEDFEEEDSDDWDEDSDDWDEEEESFLMRTNPIDVPNWVWVGGAVALVGGLGYWYFTRKTE